MVDCTYCDKAATLDRHAGFLVWACHDCDARVGVHKGTNKPLGTLANAEARKWRQKAHAIFDPMWQEKMKRERISKRAARHKAHTWLGDELGYMKGKCHIARMQTRMCKRVVALCEKYYKKVE